MSGSDFSLDFLRTSGEMRQPQADNGTGRDSLGSPGEQSCILLVGPKVRHGELCGTAARLRIILLEQGTIIAFSWRSTLPVQ